MSRSVHDSQDHYSAWFDCVENSVREAMNQGAPHRKVYSLEYFRLAGGKQQRLVDGAEKLRSKT